MSITKALGPPSTRSKSRLPRPRAFWRHPVTFSVLLVVIAACVVSLLNRVDDSWDRQALRAVEAAAENSNQPIGVISESLADDWSESMGPREEVAKSHLGAGNRYLEPIHYARYDNNFLAEEHSDRCYYFAVQSGKIFEADKVSGIVQICYLDPYRTPQAISYTSVLD